MAFTYPDPETLSQSAAEALGGTLHLPTNIPYIADGADPNGTPSLFSQLCNVLRKIMNSLDTPLRAVKEDALEIGVRPGRCRNSSDTELLFEGATGVALTDNATNYVYLDITVNPPVLTLSTVGFPATKTTFIPIAVYVTSGGQITTVDWEADRRDWVRNWVTAASTSPAGTDGTSFTLDQDNAGAGANTQLRANRGTDNAEDACVEWDEANDRWNIRAQHTTATYAALNALSLYISGTLALDSNGAVKVAAAVAGDGLTHSAGVLAVNVDGATLTTSGDTVLVKDAGVSAAKLSDAVADKLAQVVIPDSSGASPRTITVQVKDVQGNNLAETVYLRVGVYQDADGAANATNATIAVGGVGTLVRSITATKVLVCKTNASGALELTITDGTLETVYVLAAPEARSKLLDCSDIGTIVVA